MKKIYGTVERGLGKALSLGFPTINIPLLGERMEGIYAALVEAEGKTHIAAVYADPTRQTLEAHLIDFSGDLHGREVSVTLLQKIRDSRQFEDDDEARKAIAEDIGRVREYFKKNPH